MARPFTYVSSKMYYDLESYFFKLALYTDSKEYSELPISKRNRIDEEIQSIDTIIRVMRMFRQIDSAERPVVGWKRNPDPTLDYNRVFRFSSITVASKCLGINTSHITAVCRNQRPLAGGYRFMYEEDYEGEGNHKFKFNFYKDE